MTQPLSQVDLPSLREVIETHGLDARKSLGQHFLLDMNITRKIARLSGASAEDHVIEIGPGPGGLTRALLETGARVTVIERDARCLDLLTELQTHYPDQLNIRQEDALYTDYNTLFRTPNRDHIISNLPYNISTELLTGWLVRNVGSWARMTLMFQKEVADRILARPGSKTFGRLSIISQVAATPNRAMDLPARAFSPPPKVESSVVIFEAPTEPFNHLKALETVTQHAFSQRRKMIRSTLKSLFGPSTENRLSDLGFDPTNRAEQLSVEDFKTLARCHAQQT